MTRDFLIGAGLISAGVAAMAVIIAPMGISSWLFRGATNSEPGRIIETRWASMEPPAKGDLKVTLLEPSLLDPAPFGPRDGDPIEQAMERKIFDQQVETTAKEYHREAAHSASREYCARHGMHRVYFHRHRHLIWRCHH